MNERKRAVIIYDSILNSVFNSQVLTPLLDELKKNQDLFITLISFEKKALDSKIVKMLINSHERLHCIIAPRSRYFGCLSLYFCALYLRSLFKKNMPDELIARGPLAGYIVTLVLKKPLPLRVQVRGLCAEEYRFLCENSPPSFFHTVTKRHIYRSLQKVETTMFENNAPHITFEAVSNSMKQYLIDRYSLAGERISIAKADIAASYEITRVEDWREKTRRRLSISTSAFVYCYSGSAKSWQCIDEMMIFFKEQLTLKKEAIFLILTNEVEVFTSEAKKHNLPPSSYRILNAQPSEYFEYLAAANAGLLFRKHDIINWVSRPTKMLEYQAIGLTIIHNNSIEMLAT